MLLRELDGIADAERALRIAKAHAEGLEHVERRRVERHGGVR